MLVSYSDYYPGGMLMPGRFESVDEQRHLFNGMEADGEVSGEGNSYTTQFRQYDPRLGRWKSLDPLMAMFPNMSPYVGFANNPIIFNDPYGLAPTNSDGGGDGGVDSSYETEEATVYGEDKYKGLEARGPKEIDNGDIDTEIKSTHKDRVQVFEEVEITITPSDNSPIEKTRIEKKFDRKYKRWESRNEGKLQGLNGAERYEQFAMSSRFGWRSNMEKGWFQKYENFMQKHNNSTGWDFRTSVHRISTDVKMNNSGKNTLSVNEDVGQSQGVLQINYNMAAQADRLQVINPINGEVLFDTANLPQANRGGKVAFGRGSGARIPYNLGDGNTTVKVVVNPNGGGGIDPLVGGGTVFGYKLIANPNKNQPVQSGSVLKPGIK